MNKKIIVICLMLTFIFSLCGCKLALPEGEGDNKKDKLTGVFITTEPLEEQERIYAALVEHTDIAETGEKITTKNYKFNNLNGVSFANYYIENDLNEMEPYYTLSIDSGKGICDIITKFDGEERSISGTIWLNKNSDERIFYLNPIYQTPDGKVYVLSDDCGTHIAGYGGKNSEKIQEKIKIIENGKTYEYIFTVEVFVDYAEVTENVTVIQMDKNDKEIKRDSYDVDKLPENLIIDKSISYLVVLSKSEGNSYRQLCQRDDERVAVFTKFNESICTKEYIDIEWKNK